MRLVAFLIRYARDRLGSMAAATALALPVLLGLAGLGLEIGSWYLTQRKLQNAADSAAMAGATTGGANADAEAKAVARLYDLVDGSGTVTVDSGLDTCPSGAPGCLRVTIRSLVPRYLSQLVGYGGTIVVSGVAYTQLQASALAYAQGREYCLLALATSGKLGIKTSGAPNADMTGCNVMSNTGASCNGHDLNADVGDAHGVNSNCGNVSNSSQPVVADPYSPLASGIPANPCGGIYPQEKGGAAAPGNQWSGTKNLAGTNVVCGDLQLTGNVTVNAPAGTLLVIENGQLDLNGFTLRTSAGSGLTIVFTGSNGGPYTHAPTGSGTLDIAAPSAGFWSGVAIYQDPRLTTGVDISAAGNTPAWNISGLVYLPHASVNFSGAVNKASNGRSCFVLVADNITVSGTSAILARGECGPAGLTLPHSPMRGQLVY